MSEEHDPTAEVMASFFDDRSAGYDLHMREVVFSKSSFTEFYEAISSPIGMSDEPIRVLDLGCGTGLEIEAMLRRVPSALITGIDVSASMIDRLRNRYRTNMNQITLIKDSYLSLPLGIQTFDHVVSAMTVHHLLHDAKRGLYKKIREALKPGGKYIEGDSVVPEAMESRFLAAYHQQIEAVPKAEAGHYHIDIPFSIDTQKRLLLEAGFKDFRLIWCDEGDPVWHQAVYSVTA